LEMFIYSFLVTSLSSIFALIIFSEHSSVVFPFLVTLALLPAMHKILKDQERIEERFENLSFFERYKKILEIYTFFFLGVVFSVIFTMAFLPNNFCEKLFSDQISTINAIRNENIEIQGKYYSTYEDFLSISYNNIKVLVIAFLLSFFFGSGALFILSWNASVVGVFISLYAKILSDAYDKHILISHIEAFLSISLHGIPEVFGYFLGGIAGAVLSFGLVEGENRKIILCDSFKTLLVAIFFILLGAFLESFIVASL